MFTRSNITEPKQLRDWCWQQLGGLHRERPTFGECRIGGVRFGKLCATWDLPFSEKPYLQRSWNEELDDPALMPLNSFGQLLMKLNGTFLPFGDSQMKTFELGLNCEITKHRSVSFPRVNGPAGFNASFLKPHGTISALTHVMDEIYTHFDHLFLIINFGVHYNDQPDQEHHYLNSKQHFLTNFPIALSWLNQIASRKNLTVVWLETFPQHFKTRNGYFDKKLIPSTPPPICQKVENTSSQLDWRNELVKNYLREHNLQNLHYLATREMFLPLVNEHVHKGDCTHYCYSPMLYQPIYQEMHRLLALDIARKK
jgi:hypothetical protein